MNGTIFTMAARTSNDPNGVVLIDEANGATVTLTGTTTSGTTITPMTTTSNYRGGYAFTGVPAGTYTVSATATSPNIAAASLSANVNGVVVQGNIATSMVNLLLGAGGNLCTFSGTIIQDGKPAGGASVSADVTAYTTDFDPTASSNYESTITLTTATNPDGSYQLLVPAGGTDYYIDAHSTTSMVAESTDVTAPSATTPNVVNLTLTDASTPLFANITLDIITTTLPAPTAQAVNQALMTRIAVANKRRAPQTVLNRLQQLRNNRSTAKRIVTGTVENDLYWTLSAQTGQTYLDVGVRGFNVYRALAPSSPFVLAGSDMDAYEFYYFDNDPVLSDLAPRYYTVTSFAANGQESSPATAIAATPLPPLTGITPAANGTVSLSSGSFSWAPVTGAQSYSVTIYSVNPTFNDTPVAILPLNANSATTSTSQPLLGSGLTPGNTYWWSVQAYNTADPDYATAVSFSSYQQVTVTN